MTPLVMDSCRDSHLYCRVSRFPHPELREGERWVENVIPTEEFGVYDGGKVGTFRISSPNQRVGEVAYSVYGSPIGGGLRPLFTTDPPGDPGMTPVWTYNKDWKRSS